MKDSRLQSGLTRKNFDGNLDGFTIIELMIATVVFSVVLLVILGSFLQVGRMYYKGVSLASTQNAARNLTDSITNDVRFTAFGPNYSFTSNQVVDYAGAKYFCVGAHRYTYTLGEKLTTAGYQDPDQLKGIWAETFKNAGAGVCPRPGEPGIDISESNQLLSPNMQVNKFDYVCEFDRCNISLHIIYYGGDDQVFTSSEHPTQPSLAITDPDATCTGSLFSSQFCGAIDLNTTVLTRE